MDAAAGQRSAQHPMGGSLDLANVVVAEVPPSSVASKREVQPTAAEDHHRNCSVLVPRGSLGRTGLS
jgi:hypothetical protein